MTAIKTKADAEALINQEGVEYVSVRFTDLIGVQQHFTVPASEFLKDAFDEGMPFDGSSVEGFQAINESDMKLVPDVETAYIDPFRKHKTLNVAFSIVDPLTDEPYSRDPRQVAAKAEAYLKATGIADNRLLCAGGRVLPVRQGPFRELHAALLLRGRFRGGPVEHRQRRGRGRHPEHRLQESRQARLLPGAAERSLPGSA